MTSSPRDATMDVATSIGPGPDGTPVVLIEFSSPTFRSVFAVPGKFAIEFGNAIAATGRQLITEAAQNKLVVANMSDAVQNFIKKGPAAS